MCYPNTLINGLRQRRLKNNNFPLQISHFNDYIRQSSFCLWLSKYMWPKATCHMSHMCVFVCAVMPVPVLVGGFPTIDMPSPFCVFPFSRPNWMCRRKILQMKDFQCTCVCVRGRCAAQYLCEAFICIFQFFAAFKFLCNIFWFYFHFYFYVFVCMPLWSLHFEIPWRGAKRPQSVRVLIGRSGKSFSVKCKFTRTPRAALRSTAMLECVSVAAAAADVAALCHKLLDNNFYSVNYWNMQLLE